MRSDTVDSWRKAQEEERKYWERKCDWYMKVFATGEGFLHSVEGKNILEVGCGPFGIIYRLYAPGSLKVGIDPLAGQIHRANSSHVELVRAIGEFLPFRTEVFDMVLCINVLEHTIEPISLLKETRRVLKRVDDNMLLVKQSVFPHILLRVLLPVLKYFDKTHPYHFQRDEVTHMLTKAGFRIKEKTVESFISPKRLAKGIRSLSVLTLLGRWLEMEARSS